MSSLNIIDNNSQREENDKQIKTKELFRILKFPDGSRSFDPVELLFIKKNELESRMIWRSLEFYGEQVFEYCALNHMLKEILKEYLEFMRELQAGS